MRTVLAVLLVAAVACAAPTGVTAQPLHLVLTPSQKPTDLMDALRASIAAAQGRREPAGAGGDLDELSKNELYDRAKQADIPGRSQMSREELLEALRAA